MNASTALESLGLSGREARVYLALLDAGPTTTGLIIRKTGISSSKIYDVLEKLEHKGIVTHIIKNNKKQFHAVNPVKLSDLVKEKETLLQGILPQLQSLFAEKREEIQAEIYKGKEGMKFIFEDILKENREWYAFGASGKSALTLPYYMPQFYRKMLDKKIRLNILYTDSEFTRQQKKDLIKYTNIKIKFLPKEIKNLMVVFIYSDKVAIIPITETVDVEPLAILIRSKESVESYKSYFEWFWKRCK